MSYILILELILALIILVSFFILTSNVARMKKILSLDFKVEEFIKMAKEESYVGNKDKAKEYLLRAKFKVQNILDTSVDNVENEKDLLKDINEELKKINKL